MAMRFWRSLVRGRLAAVGFFTALSCGACGMASAAEDVLEAAACASGEAGQHGTQINWLGSVDEAARDAAERGKLVFVMQISGNFAREEFT